MPNKFCHDCGKSLPLVAGMQCCPFCGVSLASLEAKPPVREQPNHQQATVYPIRANLDDDDGDDIRHFEVRQTKLEVEIMKPRQQIERIGDVAAGIKYVPSSEKRPKLTKKFFKEQLAQTLKEGEALKPDAKSHSIDAE